ncbi:MAG: flagellar export protein FliJ [Nitrospinae bacterium]|nr:flagellar export protein FliJ [Nitrospinota bacterium]
MFRFRLQAVLDHRKRQEEEKQRELALVNRDLMRTREELEALIIGREEGAQKLTELERTAKDVREMKLYEDFLDGRDMDIAWKRKEVANVMERVRQKQLELQEYLKRRRVMEIYRDRLRDAYTQEEKRRERILADEVATQMWFREA